MFDCSIRVTDSYIRVYQSFSVFYGLVIKDLWHGTNILHAHYAKNYASIIVESLTFKSIPRDVTIVVTYDMS